MKRINVLMIEDSKFAADINVRYIKKSGFDIEYQVVSEKAAMKEALQKKAWSLILSDNCMPNFSALEALEVRNQLNSSIPFIIVSEFMPETEIMIAHNLGLTAFVSKGDLIELGTLIQRLIQHR